VCYRTRGVSEVNLFVFIFRNRLITKNIHVNSAKDPEDFGSLDPVPRGKISTKN